MNIETGRAVYCARCGEPLNKRAAVALELDNDTGRYHATPGIPAGHVSQGWFDFGSACARAVLRNDGENVPIRGQL